MRSNASPDNAELTLSFMEYRLLCNSPGIHLHLFRYTDDIIVNCASFAEIASNIYGFSLQTPPLTPDKGLNTIKGVMVISNNARGDEDGSAAIRRAKEICRLIKSLPEAQKIPIYAAVNSYESGRFPSGYIFKLEQGVPMGSNASPDIADLTLSFMEYRFLCNNPWIHLHLFRYIDDIIVNCANFAEIANSDVDQMLQEGVIISQLLRYAFIFTLPEGSIDGLYGL
ncbi:unnamed protein product [Gongylonema pulchrum]|uniref:Reverse transcriptase domain-containing protein n=1 Tax=Gongylonema pulchrum TaxID=637853 RepID=A0A183DN66_9BILA|nr:unnamed protein product [Gongylonema pulchrum]